MEALISITVNILATLVALGILVTIHEYGHFWVARRCGVKIERFSIGFGKALFSWTRGETEYRIAMLPLGGYVKMYGDEQGGETSVSDRHRAFNHKNLFQRSLIVAAGPVANFALAIALYWFLFVSGVSGIAPVIGSITNDSPAALAGLRGGDEIVEVDGDATQTWQEVYLSLINRLGETGSIVFKVKSDGSDNLHTLTINIERWLADVGEPDALGSLGLQPYTLDIPAQIGELADGGRAESAGLQAGDLITAVNGEELRGWVHWVEVIRANPENDLLITIQRNGMKQVLTLRPEQTLDDNGENRGYIGAGVQEPEVWPTLPESMNRDIRYSVFAAVPQAFKETGSNIVFVLSSLKKIVVGLTSVENLAGPITIAQVAGQTASYGLESYVNFLAILSISLGVFNLLPVPLLDGGHLFFYFIEAVIRRPIPEKIQAMGMQIGVMLIAGLMFIVIYNDVNRFL